jgi:hypothetical protein
MTVMFIMLGVVSELLVRIYHESQGRKIYKIRRLTRQYADLESAEARGGDRFATPPIDPVKRS